MFIKRRNLPSNTAELSKVAARAVQIDVAVLMNCRCGFATSALIDFVMFVYGLAGSD
jgi:hypothetical protein